MNIDKLVDVAITVVLAVALTVNLDRFTWQVHLATLRLLKASQTSTWGSPRFFNGKNQ
ncbi:hypothetical protein [Bdellovibrio svalbardensis]|uniref:Uncharacterized protein n=1 Tax=Bdellovibrio svalbardensis TaxID=2972972 RepID=A0ABT6DLS1_9BACT|nr:hypothetical protein [Bdellovibrio svalbardensis]MDG0817826.1 hypothetical protein [Bdellovibrio svalbardensis]